MLFYNSQTYVNDLKIAISDTIGIDQLRNKSILITGSTGLIGSFLVDMLCYENEGGANITVYATGRNISRLQKRFSYIESDKLILLEHDVNHLPQFDHQVDYIIHAASNAYPAVFTSDPVGTIMSNVVGTKFMLDYGYTHGAARMLFVSSGEVYGQGEMDLDSYQESYSGPIDSTSPRSCYPNSKRAAETLCVSYTKQYGFDTVIVRPSHVYGPNTQPSDNRASVQFINSGISGSAICLSSLGKQVRSYTYICDAASGILSVLLKGESSEAYNIACDKSVTTIAGFAKEVAKQVDTQVVYNLTSNNQSEEQTPITKQVLNNDKLKALGWDNRFDVRTGILHTISVLQELK